METEMLWEMPTQPPLPFATATGGHIRADTGSERSALRWNYYSVKNESYVACASPDCLRALYHAEVSTDVVGYRTRVEPLPLRFGRERVRFEAHLEEIMRNGRVVATCFWDLLGLVRGRLTSKQSEILEGAQAYYSGLGIRFRVQGGVCTGEQHVNDAVEAIQTFRRTHLTDADIGLVKNAIGDRSHAPLAELRDRFKSPALGFAKLSAMMVRRIVAIDLAYELGPTSLVRLVDHD